MKKFFNWLWSFFKAFRVRAGLDQFISRYIKIAVSILFRLAETNSNRKFDEWKHLAIAEFKAQLVKDGVEIRDNWIQIVLALGFEHFKELKK